MVAVAVVEAVDVVMDEESGFGMSSRDGAQRLCLEGGESPKAELERDSQLPGSLLKCTLLARCLESNG